MITIRTKWTDRPKVWDWCQAHGLYFHYMGSEPDGSECDDWELSEIPPNVDEMLFLLTLKFGAKVCQSKVIR